MLIKRPESRSAAALSRTRSCVAPGTNRSTTLRVIVKRSAVCCKPCDRLAAKIAGRSVLLNSPDLPVITAPPLVRGHVRVAVIGGRHERLLDRAGGRPAQQVQRRAGFVIGTRTAGA